MVPFEWAVTVAGIIRSSSHIIDSMIEKVLLDDGETPTRFPTEKVRGMDRIRQTLEKHAPGAAKLSSAWKWTKTLENMRDTSARNLVR
jgi:hypothetical protein